MDSNQGSTGPGRHEWSSLEAHGQGPGDYCLRCGHRWSKNVDGTLCPGRAPAAPSRVVHEYDPYA